MLNLQSRSADADRSQAPAAARPLTMDVNTVHLKILLHMHLRDGLRQAAAAESGDTKTALARLLCKAHQAILNVTSPEYPGRRVYKAQYHASLKAELAADPMFLENAPLNRALASLVEAARVSSAIPPQNGASAQQIYSRVTADLLGESLDQYVHLSPHLRGICPCGPELRGYWKFVQRPRATAADMAGTLPPVPAKTTERKHQPVNV